MSLIFKFLIRLFKSDCRWRLSPKCRNSSYFPFVFKLGQRSWSPTFTWWAHDVHFVLSVTVKQRIRIGQAHCTEVCFTSVWTKLYFALNLTRCNWVFFYVASLLFLFFSVRRLCLTYLDLFEAVLCGVETSILRTRIRCWHVCRFSSQDLESSTKGWR